MHQHFGLHFRVLVKVAFRRDAELQAARDALEYAVAKVQSQHQVEVGLRQEQRRNVQAVIKPLGSRNIQGSTSSPNSSPAAAAAAGVVEGQD